MQKNNNFHISLFAIHEKQKGIRFHSKYRKVTSVVFVIYIFRPTLFQWHLLNTNPFRRRTFQSKPFRRAYCWRVRAILTWNPMCIRWKWSAWSGKNDFSPRSRRGTIDTNPAGTNLNKSSAYSSTSSKQFSVVSLIVCGMSYPYGFIFFTLFLAAFQMLNLICIEKKSEVNKCRR